VRIHRELIRTRETLFGRNLWSRGYCVNTVGLDEAMIRRYIEEQDKHEREQERGLSDDVD
jgi:putative transposase